METSCLPQFDEDLLATVPVVFMEMSQNSELVLYNRVYLGII